jgi:alkylation response protein AidB-like acyl-CoA dehydrogenase
VRAVGPATEQASFEGRPVGARTSAELVLTRDAQAGHLPAETARTSTTFTIFEGTSEIQRMIIGQAVTGLNVH